jgi:hypothetical protein
MLIRPGGRPPGNLIARFIGGRKKSAGTYFGAADPPFTIVKLRASRLLPNTRTRVDLLCKETMAKFDRIVLASNGN